MECPTLVAPGGSASTMSSVDLGGASAIASKADLFVGASAISSIAVSATGVDRETALSVGGASSTGIGLKPGSAATLETCTGSETGTNLGICILVKVDALACVGSNSDAGPGFGVRQGNRTGRGAGSDVQHGAGSGGQSVCFEAQEQEEEHALTSGVAQALSDSEVRMRNGLMPWPDAWPCMTMTNSSTIFGVSSVIQAVVCHRELHNSHLP